MGEEVCCGGADLALFGGDLNLRAAGFRGAVAQRGAATALAPAGRRHEALFQDCWELAGGLEGARFTWDLRRNDNVSFGRRAELGPRCRFDRVYAFKGFDRQRLDADLQQRLAETAGRFTAKKVQAARRALFDGDRESGAACARQVGFRLVGTERNCGGTLGAFGPALSRGGAGRASGKGLTAPGAELSKETENGRRKENRERAGSRPAERRSRPARPRRRFWRFLVQSISPPFPLSPEARRGFFSQEANSVFSRKNMDLVNCG
jgi:hypothetical protein